MMKLPQIYTVLSQQMLSSFSQSFDVCSGLGSLVNITYGEVYQTQTL